MISEGGADRKALVAAMRTLKFQKLDLPLVPKYLAADRLADETSQRPSIPRLSSPGARASGALILGFWGTLVFSPYWFSFNIFDVARDVPARFFWPIAAFLAWITFKSFKTLNLEDTRVQTAWSEMLARNGMLDVQDRSTIAGAIDPGTGVLLAVQYIEPPMNAVTFGSADAWFDPDIESRIFSGRMANSLQLNPLFVRISLPELDFAPIYVTPRRPIDKSMIPKLSEVGFESLRKLATANVVVIGAGAILLSQAGTSEKYNNPTMAGTLAEHAGWLTCINMIRGPLADIVEGLG